MGAFDDSSVSGLVEGGWADNPSESSTRQMLRPLTYREREIIKLRYGISVGHPYTLQEVGRVFNITRERAADSG